MMVKNTTDSSKGKKRKHWLLYNEAGIFPRWLSAIIALAAFKLIFFRSPDIPIGIGITLSILLVVDGLVETYKGWRNWKQDGQK